MIEQRIIKQKLNKNKNRNYDISLSTTPNYRITVSSLLGTYACIRGFTYIRIPVHVPTFEIFVNAEDQTQKSPICTPCGTYI